MGIYGNEWWSLEKNTGTQSAIQNGFLLFTYLLNAGHGTQGLEDARQALCH